jgi:PilZ domain
MARSDSRVARTPAAAARPADDAFLAHVDRVFSPRPAQRFGAVARPARPAVADPPAYPARRPQTPVALRCRCGWRVECLPPDADRFVRRGCLLCGGALGAGPAPSDPAAPGDGRRRPRRRPRGGARVEVRRADEGGGRDLALALADVCSEGLGVWLKAALRPGEPVVVTLATSPTRGAVLTAEVRWCAPAKDWTYRAGLRLCRPLADAALAEVAL